MLKQNWFEKSNMEMFHEYFDCQYFYDTESKAIYLVTDGQYGIVVQELQEDSEVYGEYHKIYEEWKDKSTEREAYKINLDKLKNYMTNEDIMEFASDEECLEYCNIYDYQDFASVDEMKIYQGKYGFNIGKKRYCILRDEVLDVWEPVTKEVLFYVACLERYLALGVKAEEYQTAMEVINKAYDTWCQNPDEVGDACCEEYICKCLEQNGIEYQVRKAIENGTDKSILRNQRI